MATLRTDASDRPSPKPAAETARLLTRAAPVSQPSDLRLTSFSDLAWAHWHWERQRADGRIDPEVQREYERRLLAFQDRHGEILDAYWSIHEASAVALSERRKRSPLHPFGERVPRYHRATEWATR